ncbi:MAG: hypothetical protein QOF01_3939, partial [Thermomicrobiales bacterium]|jgi:uncharacterized protein YuzE|nr:hypothetical protein [Thermomicrobiales bacterium]
MKISYDRETDSLTITLRHEPIGESDVIGPDVIADLAADGRIVRFEILRASQLVEDPDRVTLEIAEPVVAMRR